MGIPVSLPLDEGFLRRECPNCEGQFKWHDGPTSDRPEDAVDPAAYYCPYCGVEALLDQWWTPEQLEYVEAIGVGEISRELQGMFDDLERSTRNSLINFKATTSTQSQAPHLLHEPADMLIVQSPCHPWEPIKVAEDWQERLHCLVCGEVFAV